MLPNCAQRGIDIDEMNQYALICGNGVVESTHRIQYIGTQAESRWQLGCFSVHVITRRGLIDLILLQRNISKANLSMEPNKVAS